MVIDPRVLWWALVPILLIVCITVALWDLRGRDGHPGDAPQRLRSQETMKAPAEADANASWRRAGADAPARSPSRG